MKKVLKNKSGITLISLVIIIIVLLILAGVSIATLTGENGLLLKAEEAKNETTEAEVKEKIQLVILASKASNKEKIEKGDLEKELINEFGEGNYELIAVREDFIIKIGEVYYKTDGTIIEKSENKIEYAGDLSKGKYEGTSEETAYRINCIEDLVEWSNNYSKYKDNYIILERTLDFEDILSYNDYKAKTIDINQNGKLEALITELTTESGFKPIEVFAGTFDGKENEIRNIYENTTRNAGFFAGVSGNVTIKNLGTTGKIISTNSAEYYTGAGGIIGFAGVNTKTKIFNCYSSVNIEAACPAGRIGRK